MDEHSAALEATVPPTLDQLSQRMAALLATIGLMEKLEEAAARSLVRSLQALGDWPEAAFHAGQSLEHLAKSVVFHRDRTRLTHPNKPEQAAFLSGAGHPDVKSLGDVYTVRGPEAVRVAYQLEDLPPPSEDELVSVFYARNAAAHLGFGDFDTAVPAVAATLRLLTPLLQTSGQELAPWIGDDDLAQAAMLLIELPLTGSHYDVVQRATVHAKLANARHEWAEFRSRVTPSILEAIAVAPVEPEWSEARVLRACPTGGHLAWFVKRWERSEEQFVDDPDHSVDMEAYVGGLACALCGLDLADDEVEDMGLSEVIERDTWER